MIFGEELSICGFVAVAGRAASQGGNKKHFVGVERIRGVVVEVAIKDGSKFGDANFVAGFFAGFASGGDGGRFADVGPTAREGPAAILEFANEQDASIVESGDAHVDFGSSVAGLLGEDIGDADKIGRADAGGHHFRGNVADFVIPLNVKFVFAVGEPALRNSLEPAGPSQPFRSGHENILTAEAGGNKWSWLNAHERATNEVTFPGTRRRAL